jgi:hypothetical protein
MPSLWESLQGAITSQDKKPKRGEDTSLIHFKTTSHEN